ncbi:MAG: glycosyltransferase family 4 protein [Kouleothrix sp.]|nr:glycosyltransferase family 4 protein [Kouleothrix sp.]
MSSGAQTPTELRIGFISTRFAGTDGVSLEAAKWVAVLERLGHECFYFAGQADTPPDRTRVVPEAFWEHPDIAEIQNAAFSQQTRPITASHRISVLKERLKEQIYLFADEFGLDLLIVQNALSIPMNIPLGLALTEFIAETAFPTIAHHHDFFWERKRFLTNCVWDYLNMSFPPNLPSIRHVVINSSGRHQLGLRAGVPSVLIPNVMDFDNPPPPPDGYVADLRADLSVEPGEYLLLQPTRVVQRKGIEHAIELVHRLSMVGVSSRLVISHASGDEGDSYEQRVREYAALLQVPTRFVANILREQRGTTVDGRKVYTLDDVYMQADLVTYPSTIEGFGNAFLEAIYFRRPIVVNAYSIYAIDIKPKGFKVIEFDGYMTDETVRQTRDLLENPALVQELAEHNYQLARRYYSYGVLERSLKMLIVDLFGVDPANTRSV